MICLYLLWLNQLAVFGISLFDCILYCKALALCLFSIVSVVDTVLDLGAVPSMSSDVPLPTHDF